MRAAAPLPEALRWRLKDAGIGVDAMQTGAAGHAGVAYAFAGLLRAFPWHARRGQVFLPMQVFARHGVTRDDLTAGRGGPGLLAALAELRAIARDHLRRARALRATVPSAILPAFLPVALVEPYLRRMEGRSYDPFRTVVDLPQWKKQWLLWRAARRGAV